MSRAWLGVLAAATAACVDFSIDPSEVAAIEFAPFPTPSVIQGDTLRTVAGARYQLDVKVYTSDGKLAQGRRVTFLTADTLSRVSSANFLIADSALQFTPGGVLTSRVVASVGALQSVVRQVAVVPRPVLFRRQGTATRDTIAYRSPGVASDTSMALQVRIHADTTGTTPVPSYLVVYRLLNFANANIPATDTTRAFFLVSDDGRVTAADTTDISGIASRRLRFRIRAGQAAVDSVRIVADIRVPRQTFSSVEWIVRVQSR